MGNQEIKTITEAMVSKQTWLRKSLSDFLVVWVDITLDDISGHMHFELYRYTDHNDFEHRIILKRGVAEIDGEVYHDGWCAYDNYLDINTMPIHRVKKIINAIDEKLSDYFKTIQADIVNIDVSAEKINTLVKKLS